MMRTETYLSGDFKDSSFLLLSSLDSLKHYMYHVSQAYTYDLGMYSVELNQVAAQTTKGYDYYAILRHVDNSQPAVLKQVPIAYAHEFTPALRLQILVPELFDDLTSAQAFADLHRVGTV